MTEASYVNIKKNHIFKKDKISNCKPCIWQQPTQQEYETVQVDERNIQTIQHIWTQTQCKDLGFHL